jgi:serine/threonine protein kinase
MGPTACTGLVKIAEMSDTDEIDVFGPYQIHECLGAGGMAIVHRASVDLGEDVRRDVALKRLLPQLADDNLIVQDFIREAKLSAQLQHPNIVKIVELGQVGREYFIAMELISGAPLMQVMRKAHVSGKPAPIGVVLSILMEMCDALDYAHHGSDEYGEPLGIVHRDLSPSNLIITDDGHIKVIDFGVAKAVAGKFITNTGLVKGKLGYMSVEALAATSLDARADLWAAGVIAWELLTARRLFKGTDDLDTIRRVRTAPVPRPSTINRSCPGGLDALVLKALARARDDRWASASDMRAALELVRRPYRDQSDARQVALWKRVMLGETAIDPDAARGDTDAETTHSRLANNELEDVGEDGPPIHAISMLDDRNENSDPSIQYSFDPPDEDVAALVGAEVEAPDISIVARGDTLDEPAADTGEDDSGVVIEQQVLDVLPEPITEHRTYEDEGPWQGASPRDTQLSPAVTFPDESTAS